MIPTAPLPDDHVSRTLARDYWLVTSAPVPGTTSADIAEVLHEHMTWILSLEARGVILASGPLTSGPGVGPGSGVTVLRVADEAAARTTAAGDPFVLAGLRTFTVQGWRLNEGFISVQVSLGTGMFQWLD